MAADRRLLNATMQLVLVLGCLIAGLLSFGIVWFSMPDLAERNPGRAVLDLVLGVAFSLAAPWLVRMRYAWLNLAVIGTSAGFSSFALPIGVLLVVQVARVAGRPVVLALWLVLLAGSTLGLIADPSVTIEMWWLLPVSFAMAALPVLVGLWLRGRDALRSEREAEAKARAQADERLQIVREVHDTLAHHLSLISLHAGALEIRDDLEADQMRTTASTVRSLAAEASSDLRGVLQALRDAPASGLPLPDAGDLPAIAAQARRAGVDVRFSLELDLTALPVATSRHVHRITRELLANATKHAQNVPIDIRLSGDDGRGVLIVSDNPRSDSGQLRFPQSGLGMASIDERVRLIGGRLTIASTDHRHRVEVWLPWEP